jgi:hypothetical protein
MREAVVTYAPYLGGKCSSIGFNHGSGYIKANELVTTILGKPQNGSSN